MDRETKAWLYDIFKSIEEIDQFLPEEERSFENYTQ